MGPYRPLPSCPKNQILPSNISSSRSFGEDEPGGRNPGRKVCDRIIESKENYSALKKGSVDMETFQEDILDKSGGTFYNYRFDMDLYGFIKRQQRGKKVTITQRYIDVADPVREDDRLQAKRDAVREIELLRELISDGFDDTISEKDLRIWLIEEKSISRDSIKEKHLSKAHKIFMENYTYLKSEEEEEKMEERKADEEKTMPSSSPEEMEEVKFGEIRAWLPKENLQEQWKIFKETMQAYVKSKATREGNGEE